MKRWICVLAILLTAPLMAEDSRTVDAVYTARLGDLPKDARELKVWIPLPVSRADQSISSVEIDFADGRRGSVAPPVPHDRAGPVLHGKTR